MNAPRWESSRNPVNSEIREILERIEEKQKELEENNKILKETLDKILDHLDAARS